MIYDITSTTRCLMVRAECEREALNTFYYITKEEGVVQRVEDSIGNLFYPYKCFTIENKPLDYKLNAYTESIAIEYMEQYYKAYFETGKRIKNMENLMCFIDDIINDLSGFKQLLSSLK